MHNPQPIPVAPAADSGPGLASPVARRSFLRYTGAGLAAGGLWLAGCSDDEDDPSAGLLDVGSGDIGILNYAYALEQLEAAFYTQVVSGAVGSYFAGAREEVKAIFRDLRDHEVIHRDFFKAAIPVAQRLKDLTPDFSTIDFTVGIAAAGAAKPGVLQAAMAFEDLGVAAYNGAGRFITDVSYLTLAGKIVSVEARHAALIRELMTPNSFVSDDVVVLSGANPTGTERSKRPPVVLETVNRYLAADSKLRATSFA
ncbi:ferritin-like domain-containing protein [Hymenobacter sp.]|uniref:ferritin-like domain-containing protein n=1 Tax=Hymenobacter sp. TaxID=1898978 RepID=UPI00286C39BB|nr:ferritin-like domain-containing protein [Hymenobacter sp.]